MAFNERAFINTPCGVTHKDSGGKIKTEYPAVDCNMKCKHCGWNPFEAKRRMNTGIILERDGRKSIHFVRA